jgi:phytoene dehydrogenase-like protein
MTHDAIVVGAGLAGLMAALTLQRAGRRVLLLERRPVAGGLCGTFERDGHEFVIGCNDFGSGLASALRELGVELAFHHPRARFHFRHGQVHIPLDLRTGLWLLRKAPALARAVAAARWLGAETIGDLVDHHVRDPDIRDLACLLIYATGRSPDDAPLSAMRDDFSREYAYGYDRSCTPVGGPGVMVARMVERFRALGGELLLGCECAQIVREGDTKRVSTSAGEFSARRVLSSQGRWDAWPREAKAGLEMAMFLVALPHGFAWPQGHHTIGWFAPDAPGWLRRLDAGLPCDTFGFHLFRSDLPPRPDHYTINVCTLLPRGEREVSEARRQALQDYVFGTIDRHVLPGFRQAVRYSSFLSPSEFEVVHGLSSAPSPRLAPRGFHKPPSHDPETDIHFLGTSVHPPGEHAGAAALSGRRAAAEILRLE